jgi:hypothetical protein
MIEKWLMVENGELWYERVMGKKEGWRLGEGEGFK